MGRTVYRRRGEGGIQFPGLESVVVFQSVAEERSSKGYVEVFLEINNSRYVMKVSYLFNSSNGRGCFRLENLLGDTLELEIVDSFADVNINVDGAIQETKWKHCFRRTDVSCVSVRGEMPDDFEEFGDNPARRFIHPFFVYLCEDQDGDTYLIYIETLPQTDAEWNPLTWDEEGEYWKCDRTLVIFP